MTVFPAPIIRALAGLNEGSGRTVVISGPPISGKSQLLDDLRAHLRGSGGSVIDLRGLYRERETAYGAIATLEVPAVPTADQVTEIAEPSGAAAPGSAEGLPVTPFAYPALETPAGRRGRGGGRRGTIMGQTYVTRPRAAEAKDPQQYWAGLVRGFSERSTGSVAVLVEDATLVDPESRDFLIFLSDRARLRPLLLVYVLDTGTPAYGAWEERLLGRGDVDWVKFARSKPDPRDRHRLKEAFELLPDRTRRVVGLTALMGGHVSEVSLGRVTRMSWRHLADALLPATEAKLVKVENAKVVITHDAWIQQIPDLVPEGVRSEMHREIAEALAALNPEPSLLRRLELAGHFYEWYRGPNALRYLLETAELTERLFAFDTAEEVLAKALACVPSLPASDRAEAEAELKLFRARVLIAGGRIPEAEQGLREGVTAALTGGLATDRLEEWIEAILPALRTAGPRSSLGNELVELADRCHDHGAASCEVLFESVIVEYEVERNRPAKAREGATRAVKLARDLGRGPIQALALLAVAVSRVDGTPEERQVAEKFVRSAETMLGASRRYEFQQLAEEVHIRLLEAKGERTAALRARERGVPVAQRIRALTIELSHQLGIVDILLDSHPDGRMVASLKRAREITELLHLLPPSTGLLRLWLLEGRYHAQTGSADSARDRWQAIADLAGNSVPPRIRVEAILRLAILEVTANRDEVARQLLGRLEQPELIAAIKPEWAEWLSQVRRRTGMDGPSNTGAPVPPS